MESPLTTILPEVIENVTKVTFSWYDYILFTLMLIVSTIIGIYFGCFGSKQSTTNEYLMGSKKMQVFPITMSLIASHISGITLLGVPADVYRFGASYWLLAPATVLITFATIYIFLPIFYKLQITSTYEYLERRFNSTSRTFASFLYALSMFLFLPIVVYIPALAFSAATGVNVHLITPIVCGVCIFYTTIGGLKAVVYTDTIQFTITIGTVVTVFFLGVRSVGGFSNVWNISLEGHRLDIFDFDPDPTKRDTFWSVLIGISCGWLSLTGIHQSCVQKFLSLPTYNKAKLSVVLFYFGIIFMSSFSIFIGLIMYARYAKCDPFTLGEVTRNDQLLPYYVMDVASHVPGLSGLFIAGVFCAALSTLSASLNCLAGTVYEDFIEKWIGPRSEKTASNILKLVVVVSGVICTALVFVFEHLGGILPLVFSMTALSNGPLLGMFVLGALVPRAHSKGTLYGAIIALLFCGWIIMTAQYYKAYNLLEYDPKPTSIEGCNITTTTATTIMTNWVSPSENYTGFANISNPFTENITLDKEETKFQPFWLYRISYYYYTPLGALVTIIFGILFSFLMKNPDKPVERDVLSPVIYFLLPEEKSDKKLDVTYYSVEQSLQMTTVNSK